MREKIFVLNQQPYYDGDKAPDSPIFISQMHLLSSDFETAEKKKLTGMFAVDVVTKSMMDHDIIKAMLEETMIKLFEKPVMLKPIGKIKYKDSFLIVNAHHIVATAEVVDDISPEASEELMQLQTKYATL